MKDRPGTLPRALEDDGAGRERGSGPRARCGCGPGRARDRSEDPGIPPGAAPARTAAGEGGGEVGERSGWGRDGDAGSPGYFAGEEGQRPMDSIPRRVLPLPGTVTCANPRWGSSCQSAAALVWLRTASAPQASTAAIHRPFSLSRCARRVNTAMNAVQAAGLFPRGSALAANSESFELRERDNAVLVRRQPGDRGVRSAVGEFCMHGLLGVHVVILLTAGSEQPPQGAGNMCRFRRELAPGEADDLIAEQLQLDVAGPIRFECRAGAVRPVAVELDDQAVVEPVEVSNEGADGRIHLGLGNAVPAADR